VVINFLWPPEPDQNMPYLSLYQYWNQQHSTKTEISGNGQILWLGIWKLGVSTNRCVAG